MSFKKPLFVTYKKDVWNRIGKTADFIFQIGDSTDLRKPSQVVDVQDPHLQKEITYLKKCLIQYKSLTGYGRGIAAVQVGIPKRFFVVFDGENLITVINPRVFKKSEKLLKYPEMCMSAAPLIAPIVRPSWIEFEYYDEFGVEKMWNTRDETKKEKMMNRVFQHELDHLEGIINIDLVSSRDLIFESDPDFYKTAKFEMVG